MEIYNFFALTSHYEENVDCSPVVFVTVVLPIIPLGNAGGGRVTNKSGTIWLHCRYKSEEIIFCNFLFSFLPK